MQSGSAGGGGPVPTRRSGPEGQRAKRDHSQDGVRNGGDAGSKKAQPRGVSHVVCKFYKAGNCAAGEACPFSHEVGQGKLVCQYFLRGSCKFNHKCALAHILPGQSMSHDRRNKRAAQQAIREAAGQAAPAEPPRKSFPDRAAAVLAPDFAPRSAQPSAPVNKSVHDAATGYAPGRQAFDSADPSSPLDDLDFGLPDDFEPGPSASSAGPAPMHIRHRVGPSLLDGYPSTSHAHFSGVERPSGIPVAGSPSSAVPIAPGQRAEEPPHAASPFSTSPFGTGSKSVFLTQPSSLPSEDGFGRSPSLQRIGSRPGNHANGREVLLADGNVDDTDEEEDMAELLPSSLHSLLTPEERRRPRLRHDTLRPGARAGPLSQSVPVERFFGRASTDVSQSVSPSSQFSLNPSSPHRYQWQMRENFAFPTAGTVPSSPTSGPGPGSPEAAVRTNPGPFGAFSPPLVSPLHDFASHVPGSSLPQGLAAGLSRLHLQPAFHTGMTPPSTKVGEPTSRAEPVAQPALVPVLPTEGRATASRATSALSQRMAAMDSGINSGARISSPLSRD